MQAYYYSQTSYCDVTIIPTQNQVDGCECYGPGLVGASGTTQSISFGGGDISDAGLAWDGAPGESNVVITPTDADQCTLQYFPSNSPPPPPPGPSHPTSDPGDGHYYAKLLSSIIGTALVGTVVGIMMVIPKSKKEEWYKVTKTKVDPSAVIGILVVIFMIASISTTDTLRESSDDGSADIQIGVFRATVTEGTFAYTATEDCGNFGECDTSCCKKLVVYCFFAESADRLWPSRFGCGCFCELLQASQPKAVERIC
jgi:hypothetical protein